MTDQIECEIWLSMDEGGNWCIAKTGDDVASDISSEGGVCMRTVKLTVRMAPPKLAEIYVDVPDTAGTTEQIEAEAA